MHNAHIARKLGKQRDGIATGSEIESLESRVLLASIPIRNASFESNATSAAPVPYWKMLSTPNANTRVMLRSPFDRPGTNWVHPFDGNRVVQLDVRSPSKSVVQSVTLAQTLSTHIEPNTAYAFQVIAYGHDIGGNYLLQVTAGGRVLGSAAGSIKRGHPYPVTITAHYQSANDPPQLDQPITIKLVSVSSSRFSTSVIQFDSLIGDALKLNVGRTRSAQTSHSVFHSDAGDGRANHTDGDADRDLTIVALESDLPFSL